MSHPVNNFGFDNDQDKIPQKTQQVTLHWTEMAFSRGQCFP